MILNELMVPGSGNKDKKGDFNGSFSRLGCVLN